MKKKLIFMHFPKTGGTTIHNCLSQNFQNDEICPERYDSIAYWPKSRLDKFNFFSAHAFLASFTHVRENADIITFLRDPIERSLSAFDFWSSFTDKFIEENDLHAGRLTKELGINGFFGREHRQQCASLYNVYANWLLGIRFNPFGLDYHEQPAIIAERAIEVLESLSFVGISEDLNSSFQRLSAKLEIPNNYKGQQDNVTRDNIAHLPEAHEEPPVEKMTSATLEALEEATQADQLVYDYAMKKFFSGYPPKRILVGWRGPQARNPVDHDPAPDWIEAAGRGVVLEGPHLRLRPGRYTIQFYIRSAMTSPKRRSETVGHVEAVADGGRIVLNRTEIRLNCEPKVVSVFVDFNTDTIYRDIEFRCAAYDIGRFAVCSQTTLLSL